MKKILVLAEREKALSELTVGARKIAEQVEMIAIGENQKNIESADKIYYITEQPDCMMEDYKDTILEVITKEKPNMVLVESTDRCKLIAGQIAATLGTSVITDAIEISKDGVVQHMVYGGTAISKKKASGDISIVMVGMGVLDGEEVSEGKGEVEQIDFIEPTFRLKRTGSIKREKASVDLNAAKRVIGVGRGIAKEEDLEMIHELAKAIGGEVGCTRPIVEAENWMPRELYIGVTGLMLNPEVYISIGISGQVQHTVGIDRSNVVITINNDKNAPMFKQSDYGIVGDLYKVIPALTAALK